MNKLISTLLLAIVFIGCEEQEKYEMVLTYAIHFQDGTKSVHDLTFIGNEKAKAVIGTNGTFVRRSETLYLAPYNTGYMQVCNTSGQLEIINIKRKEDSHE